MSEKYSPQLEEQNRIDFAKMQNDIRFLAAAATLIAGGVLYTQREDVLSSNGQQTQDVITEDIETIEPEITDQQDNTDPEQSPQYPEFNSVINTLLDEISYKEGEIDDINTGESGDTVIGSHSYNMILGDRMLSELTIAEVIDLQAKGEIFAAGKWQIVRGNLADTAERIGIDLNRPYDESAQRELAYDLIMGGYKRPRVTAYITGESDDIDAALEDLCGEWAAVPCNDGEGMHDGVAGNSQHGGLERAEKIKQMLMIARASYLQEQEVNHSPRLVLIGDSLTVGYRDFGNIAENDEPFGVDVVKVDAEGGRPLVGGENDGLAAIEANSEAIKNSDIVFIALGTNTPESNEEYERGVRDAIEMIHAIPGVNPKIQIGFVELLYKNNTKSADTREERNTILDSVLDSYDNAYFIPIDSAEITDDNTHLSIKSYQEIPGQLLLQAKALSQNS